MLKYIVVLSLILYVVTCNISQANACFINALFSYHVHVINNLPPNTDPLIVHCASKDNDMGNHTVTTNQEFHFHFCKRPVVTLFFCHLWWGGYKDIAFEAFNAKWDNSICTDRKCYWSARDDGIYFSGDPPTNYVKAYDWE
ncbi:Plant self-incompatibility protein S1 family [Striga hermonthica]|uniref:S-protein homolog n=1 Tax=Striga hermonthica TaxID=68872 RepID=A0A9N7R169_STRHE|nr:Plant self-incompatibility protein S1 family [Striga hermonthica]